MSTKPNKPFIKLPGIHSLPLLNFEIDVCFPEIFGVWEGRLLGDAKIEDGSGTGMVGEEVLELGELDPGRGVGGVVFYVFLV